MLQKATAAQLNEICALYESVCNAMQAAGLEQWRWGEYPAADILEASLTAGTLYCLTDDTGVYAAVTIDTCADDEYAAVNWLLGQKPGLFHRLAVRPDRQGQGVARQVLAEVDEILRGLGCDCLRCDTYEANTAARALYTGLGMRTAGQVRFPFRPLPFICFEKPLVDGCALLPLKMHPAFRGGSLTPWGGEKLRTVYGKPIEQVPTGESLEVSCIPNLNSTDDAGVQLSDLIACYGERFAGKYAKGAFPLLLKFIDARESLSVQVHPNDDYAGRVENGKLGKTEAWLILDCPEDGELVYGIKPGTTLEQLKTACEQGAAVEPLLRRVRVKPGDVCFIPAGCVHAIGAGVMLYEIQQSSDVTYRFYDWDRVDAKGNRRELHLQKALDVTDLTFSLDPIPAPDHPVARVLDETYFTLDLLKPAGDAPIALPAVNHFALLTILEGPLTLNMPAASITLQKGDTLYIPTAAPALTLTGNGRAAVSMPR